MSPAVEAPVRSIPGAPSSRPADSFFESVYREAAGDETRVPWHRDGPNRPLVAWLNAEAPGLVRPGATAAVVGCGLGNDVGELVARGYEAVGFDISPAAVEWARVRRPDLADRLFVADAANPPARLRRRFDLVAEVYTLQAVPPEDREALAAGIASLLRPHGVLLAVCRGRDEADPLDRASGPPYPLTVRELTGLMARQGLAATRTPDDFMDDETPPNRRLRAVFRRS